MTTSTFYKSIIVLGIAISALPCIAQEKQITTLRFVTFPAYSAADSIELIVGEGKTVTIELPSNNLSATYQIEGMQKCTLGKTVTKEDGNADFTIYGQSQEFTSKDQLILVIRNGAKASDGLKLTAFDSSQKGFSGGKYLMMNASNAEIAGMLGSTKFMLKPNEHTLLAPEPSQVKNDRKYLYAEVHFRKGDVQRPFYTSTWRFSENARCMVFFHHDKNSKQLRTHTIRNYIE